MIFLNLINYGHVHYNMFMSKENEILQSIQSCPDKAAVM